MKKFIIKCSVFILVFFLLDKAFVVFRNLSAKHDFDKRLELVLNGKVNKDLLIFGSSRADSNIATWMLQDSLNIEAYNLSYRGATISFQEFVLKQLIVNNNKPKYIIKLLDNDFELMHQDYDGHVRSFRIDRLTPLIKYSEIRNELINKGEKNKVFSKLFVLHQLSKSNLYNSKPPKLNDTILEFGAKPNNRHIEDLKWTYKNARVYNKSLEIPDEIESFLNFQKICAEHDIKLILATSPVFYSMDDGWLERMEELILPTATLYIHNKEDKQYLNPENYFNYSHLNRDGALVYTKELIDFLKQEL